MRFLSVGIAKLKVIRAPIGIAVSGAFAAALRLNQNGRQ